MVVVILVAMLTVLAIPGMRRARDDRVAFDYARQFAGVLHRARTRAASRGAAHLVTLTPGAGGRGTIYLFEALDNAPAGAPTYGPNPVSSCKGLGQWDPAATFAPGTYDNQARIVEGVDLNTAGVNVDADIRAVYRVLSADQPFVAVCVTPGGTSYVGAGGSVAAAVTDMQGQLPFADVVEVRVQRGPVGAPVGLSRRILVAGSSAPRLKSE
jgi:type II secretory pathway pseudopilin PulG